MGDYFSQRLELEEVGLLAYKPADIHFLLVHKLCSNDGSGDMIISNIVK